MLISRKIKQSFIWASLLVLCSTMLIGLAPANNAKALPDESRDRIYISALAFCLYHKYAIDEQKETIKGTLSSYWEKEGTRKVVAVGFNIHQSGVVGCSEIIIPAAEALGYTSSPSGTTTAMQFIESQILGNDLGLNEFPNGISGEEFESKAKAYVLDTLVDKYLDPNSSSPTRIGAQEPKEIAERLLPLIDLCFAYKAGSGGYPSNQPGVRFDGLILEDGTTLDIIQRVNNGDAIVSQLGLNLIETTNIIDPAGLFGTGSEPVFRAGELRTHTRDYSLVNPALGDPYNWHFFAYGNDNRPNMTKNGYDMNNEREAYEDSINSLVSCKFIEDHPEIWQFYSLEGDKLTIDGKTAEDLVSEADEDVNYNGSEGDNVQSCEGADALGWIACPFITGLLNLSDTIFQSFIVPFLTVDPINTNSGQVYTIWSSFRTVGNVLLVFGLLFIVFGQAIGGGLIDAYTAKKAMPRIFVAAILINLSIYLVAFMVDMGNILGAGVGEMITAPLAASGQDKFVLDGVVGLVTTVGLILVIAIPILIIVLLADTRKGSKNADSGVFKNLTKGVMYFAFFIAIPLLILILSIFFTLILRLGTILFLCIISPVALALFVMPSTDKYAKKWLDLFIKSILVYPIIVAIFAVAAVLGSLLSSSVGGIDFVGLSDGLSNLTDKSAILLLTPAAPLGVLEAFFNVDGPGMLFSIASILVMFAPLAMIPFSFKLAGGLMGSILGIATKGRGGFDKVVRGDKHNPHSRFYSTWGKDGYLGKKFDNNKGVTIKGLGSRLKNIGAKKNPDGSDVFPGEGAPEIDPTTTAAGSTRTQGKKSRRNRFGGYGRNQYGPQAPNPIPTPTTPVLPSRRPKESGAVNLDETSSSRDSVSVTGTVTSTTNPTPWRTPGGQGYAPPMGGGDELTTPLEVGARPRVVLPQQEQPGAYPETAGAVPRVQTQQNQPASILVRPTATRRGESDGGIILPSDKDINVYGRQSVAENDRFKDDTSTPTSPAQ